MRTTPIQHSQLLNVLNQQQKCQTASELKIGMVPTRTYLRLVACTKKYVQQPDYGGGCIIFESRKGGRLGTAERHEEATGKGGLQ